jgi:hypothetical protein
MRHTMPNSWTLNRITLVTEKLMRLSTFPRGERRNHRQTPASNLSVRVNPAQSPEGDVPRVNTTTLPWMRQQGGQGPALSEVDRVITD